MNAGTQQTKAPAIVSDAHARAAVGYLASEVASRTGAWDGRTGELPQPPEWVELWAEAVEATREDAEVEALVEGAYAWVDKGGGEWWLDYTGPREEGTQYPPYLVVQLGRDGCFNVRRYDLPAGPEDENADYEELHVCEPGELHAQLAALQRVAADDIQRRATASG